MYLLKHMRMTPRLHHKSTEGNDFEMLASSDAASRLERRIMPGSDGVLQTLKTSMLIVSSVRPFRKVTTVVTV